MFYQLSLDLFKGNCKDWLNRDFDNKVNGINETIIDKINGECGYNTTDVENGIIHGEGGYTCRNAQDDHVVYNAHLRQRANATVIKLVNCMDSYNL